MKPRKLHAGVAERQTRWFQVPVLRDVWVQIPSPAPRKKPFLSIKTKEVFLLSLRFGDNRSCTFQCVTLVTQFLYLE